MIPLAGYADRLSVRPGERIQFSVANATGVNPKTKIVRVICADPNPKGPGVQLEPVEGNVAYVGDPQQGPGPATVPNGSYARVDDLARCPLGEAYTLVASVYPTHMGPEPQTLISRRSGTRGFALTLDGEGRLTALHGEEKVLALGSPLDTHHWYLVWLAVNQAEHRLRFGALSVDGSTLVAEGPRTVRFDGSPEDIGDLALLFAALDPEEPQAHFNGRIESPRIYPGELAAQQVAALRSGESTIGEPVVHWDFSQEIHTHRMVDMGPHGCHGVLVNTPARGMRGSNWSGAEMCWRHAPAEYGAIHFHEDDLDDCRWPVAYEWEVPQGLRSGIYALYLSTAEVEENIPFFVVPPRGKATADIALLVSTFTYTVYANHARPEWGRDPQWVQAWRTQAAEWDGYPYNPGEHRDYGLSTYNDHVDGSGISVSSWHRPMLNVRVGYVTYPYEQLRASGLRHFPADTHITAWLESQDLDYDVITDWELHQEGSELLQRYPVLLTSSHPEYHTPPMLDALEHYRDHGGRLCYLGGNGFYWKVALAPYKPGVIEIRRGEGGIRAWAAEPGEYYNQFDGEYGGLWRRNGRPPQQLCGIGFTAQGNFLGSYYRKREAGEDPRVSWIFEGVDSDIFGDHGLSGHGAAGFELDRADERLGTPKHAVVIATSENHPPDAPWVLVPEERLTHIVNWPGGSEEDLIRADMTFFESGHGGAVFSVGSITFCGSLPTNNFDNDVSRLLANVVHRFRDREPFEIPSRADVAPEEKG